MHPKIREFPSKAFYEGKITDDASILTRSHPTSLLKEMASAFDPLTFFDLLNS